jgi:hypothetical protein
MVGIYKDENYTEVISFVTLFGIPLASWDVYEIFRCKVILGKMRPRDWREKGSEWVHCLRYIEANSTVACDQELARRMLKKIAYIVDSGYKATTLHNLVKIRHLYNGSILDINENWTEKSLYRVRVHKTQKPPK